MNPNFFSRAALTTVGLCLITAVRICAQPIDIDRGIDIDPNARPIPLAMSGFSGEVDGVLRFDLFIMGFEFVAPEKAQFILHGSNATRVEGRLSDAISKAEVFGKAYAGASLRAQAHALADDVVLAVTRKKGIAQTKIAFKAKKGESGEIFVADYDGFNAVAVTTDHTTVAAPTWVPGKLMLYYTSYKLGYPDIYRQDLSTGQRHLVARYPGLSTSAAVSADGRRVAMILSKNGSPNVWVADADGSSLKQLTTNSEGDSSPCWSPDGRSICFSSRASGRSALYVISATGGPMKRLNTVGASNATEPDWSPDGKLIIFTRLAGTFEVCVVPAAGGEAKVLAAGEDPSWASNSRTVIFARRAGERRVLSLLDVPTKRVKDVQQNLGNCSQPSWAR